MYGRMKIIISAFHDLIECSIKSLASLPFIPNGGLKPTIVFTVRDVFLGFVFKKSQQVIVSKESDLGLRSKFFTFTSAKRDLIAVDRYASPALLSTNNLMFS